MWQRNLHNLHNLQSDVQTTAGATANSDNSGNSVLQAATIQHAGFNPLQRSDHGTVEFPKLASACSGLC